MNQVLEPNKTRTIFSDPLTERKPDGEALLLEKLSCTHLYLNLYWEKWKVQFLEGEQIAEKYILVKKEVGMPVFQ